MWNAIRPWLFPVWCIGCGAPDSAFCPRCARDVVPADVRFGTLRVTAAAAYEGHVRAAVLAMKRGERAYLGALAALLAPHLPAQAMVVPVVTTRRRAAERGFDQAVELARRAAALRGGTIADLLRKHGAAQRGGSRRARLAAGGRFLLRPDALRPPEVVLIDDVVTTGATLRDAAATLTSAGVRVRGAVVVANAPLRETSGAGSESHEA